MMKRIVLFTVWMFSGIVSMAQCAMCKTQLENNFSNGDPSMAAGINAGILYLLAMPYLAVLVIGYLWYKSSKHANLLERLGPR